MSESAEAWIDRTAKFAAGAHAWEEEVGRIAGDLHPSTNIQNNIFGEVAFAVLVPKMVKAVLPLLGEKPDPVRFNQYQGADKLGLLVHDYKMISDEHGKLLKTPYAKAWYDAYVDRAQLVYEVDTAAIDYYGGLPQAQNWSDRSQRLESFLTYTGGREFPAIHTLPHVANMVLHAMEFTARNEERGSPVRAATSNYRKDLLDISKVYTSGNIGHVSDRIALAMVSLSDELVRDDTSAWRSGRPFWQLDAKGMSDGDKIPLAGRAASQILAVTLLKVMERRDIRMTALMSDVAYCGWGMMFLAGSRYSDQGLGRDLVQGQWDLGVNVIAPMKLWTDETYQEEMLAEIIRQLP